MLENTIKIDTHMLNNSQTIEEAINENNISKDSIEKLNNSKDWVHALNKEELKAIIFHLSKFDGLINIELNEYDVTFKNYDSEKKLFLISLSEEWESEISMASAINTLYRIDELESIYDGKCVIDFTNKEVEKSIVDLFSEMKYHKLRYQLNIISKIQMYYKNFIELNTNWMDYKNVEKLRGIIGKEAKEHIITKKDLVNLTRVVPNIQDSIIPLLIFEGVAFSKVENMDELRYIKHNDLKGNELFIHGSEDSEVNKRVIQLSPEVANLLKEAINQDYIEKRVGSDIKVIELQDTEFALRPAVNSRKKTNPSNTTNALSFRGAYSRLAVCKDFVENMLYDINFTPSTLEKFGKVYHINKLINEGHDQIESIVMTLQRFGNWYPEEGIRSPKNSQQINRLRKVWNLYA